MGVALVLGGERHDRLRQRGREEQGPPLRRRRLEDELEILPEAEIEHLVGLVEHDRPHLPEHERAALDMVLQPSGRADDEMRAGFELPALPTWIHAADAGDHAPAGRRIKPVELALHLHRQLPCRRHDQRHGAAGRRQAVFAGEQRRADADAEGDRLAGARAGRDEQVPPLRLGREDGLLDGGQVGVAPLGESLGERTGYGVGGQGRLSAEGRADRRLNQVCIPCHRRRQNRIIRLVEEGLSMRPAWHLIEIL